MRINDFQRSNQAAVRVSRGKNSSPPSNSGLPTGAYPVPRMTLLETPFTAVLFCVGLAAIPSRGTSGVFSAHLFGPELDPNFNGRKCALPEFVGAEEVIGRGEEI